jgi:peptide/nickel transport system ATP-binding protein
VSILQFSDLTVTYGRGGSAMKAVDDVSFDVPEGSITGIVGESGSGKSTLARAAVGLTEASSGRIVFDGVDIVRARGRRAAHRRGVQMVFQDPQSCLDPRLTVRASIEEALQTAVKRRAAPKLTRAGRRDRVDELLHSVRLDAAFGDAFPTSLSGGQRQRVALVRAIAAQPRVLIADEITSALDVSVQGSVLNTLMDLHRDLGLTVVFITHNLPIVRQLCDRVIVMQQGSVVEAGPTERVLDAPQQPYTRELLAAVPRLGQRLFADDPVTAISSNG